MLLTKADKLKASRVKRNMEAFGTAMSEWCEGLPRMFTSSAVKGDGKREILGFIGQALACEQQPAIRSLSCPFEQTL